MLNNLMLKGVTFMAGADVQASNAIAGPFQRVIAAIKSVITQMNGLAPWIAALCAVIIGVMWMSGQRGSQFAKSWAGKVVVGIAWVTLATVIVPWLFQIFGGTSVDMNM